MSLITVQVRLFIVKEKSSLYALIRDLYAYYFFNLRTWNIFICLIFSNIERSCKITTDKLIILIRDIPIKFETRSETGFRYIYFSDKGQSSEHSYKSLAGSQNDHLRNYECE